MVPVVMPPAGRAMETSSPATMSALLGLSAPLVVTITSTLRVPS